jgi:hypothetical protein
MLLLLFAQPQKASADPGSVSPAYTAMCGAYRAIATDEGAIEYNPAGMTRYRNYILGGGYRRGEVDDSYAYSLSLVDSTAPMFAAGVRVGRYDSGGLIGKRTRLDTATLALASTNPENQRVHYGVSAKYLKFQGEHDYTFDVATMATIVDPIFIIAVFGENLNSVEVPGYTKRAGVAFGLNFFEAINLDYDLVWNFDDDDVVVGEMISHHIGAEIRGLRRIFIFRGGFENNRAINENFWGAGIGLQLVRIRLDYGYRRMIAKYGLIQHQLSLSINFN